MKINYTENIGTSSENTQNSVNQLKLNVQSQTDESNQYKEQDIQILNNDQKVAQVEYIQEGNTYGIRFLDLFDQYIVVENENLKDLFKKFGYSDVQVENIPDKIEWNPEYDNLLKLSEQEKQNIKNKYMNIINRNMTKDNFSKQKNQTIQINGKNIRANSYTLTITKEQLNAIYLKMLEEMKQDEMILTKIDNLQTILEKYQLTTEETSFKEQFIQQIEDHITQINRNNIGIDETKIIVYEANGITVSTMIQTSEYEIYMDLITNPEENYMQIAYKDNTQGKEQENTVTYQKTTQKMSIVFDDKKDGKTKQYSLESDEKAEGNHYTKNTLAKYQDETNRVEIVSDKEIELVNSFSQEVALDEENAINLSKIEGEQAKEIIGKVSMGVVEKTNEIMTTAIHLEDIAKVLQVIGIMKEEQVLQAGITQTERNRFNSQFEILQGENLQNADVLKIIDAIKQNLNDMELITNTELRLKLDRLNHNDELVTQISSFIEQQESGRKYTVTVEYDETTGLVSAIRLTMFER